MQKKKLLCMLSAVAKWHLKANETFFNISLKNLCIFKSEYIHSISIQGNFLYNWNTKTHILSPKKFSFAFLSHLLFVGYIFQLRHLQAYDKRGLSFVWKRHVPTGNRYVVRCGWSHSDLFLKIDTRKKETKPLKNTLKGVSFQ